MKSRGAMFRKGSLFALYPIVCVLRAIAGSPQEHADSHLILIGELQNSLATNVQQLRSFRVEGVVCALAPQRNVLVLQDASASVLLELPSLNPVTRVGDRVAVEGNNCPLTRTRYGIQAAAGAVVENDGIHSAVERSGMVFLEGGTNPIRVEWFNGLGNMALKLEYEGPGVPRQMVPASTLWHGSVAETDQGGLKPGLDYAGYEGNDLYVLPDFSSLSPVIKGVATNFDLSYRTRGENCGLTFDGFIQIGKPGIYTFYLTSDDGSRLYAGKPGVTSAVIASPGPTAPVIESFEQAFAGRGNHRWIELDGEVAFISQNQRALEIEMMAGGVHVPVTIVEGGSLFSTNLLHRWIQVNGICEFSGDAEGKNLVGVMVPGSGQVKIFDSASSAGGFSTNDLLTTAAEVRRLKPSEARRHIPARIRGVAIYANSTAMVLQDSSGGVYVGSRAGGWVRQPRLGELWEIEGLTDPGDFSPVIIADTAVFFGDAALPEPIRPTRDQLMNGNLDAEYGELRGVLTSVSKQEITLLTPDGKVTVLGNGDRPLPQLPATAPGGGSLLSSVVRIRGCFATLVDLRTRQVIPGKIYLYPALVEVEDPPPADPFLLPARKASDLMWFDARASALQRIKLAGQIIYVLPGEYFILDGESGFRVYANDPPALRTGDLVEAVGFPKLGGPSPVLLEARIRRTGNALLPDPVQVSSQDLLGHTRDSTLVEIEGLLISDTVHPDEEVLELQSGPNHFVARLKSDQRAGAPLPAGCRLKLSGVYASADEDHVGANLAPFELLLNRAADIVVLQQPPWWTLRRALAVMAALAGALGITFFWVALLRRKVDERTAQLKREVEERRLVEQRHAIEQERTRVAQDLHDELGAGLTEVSMLGSLANTPAIPAEAKERYLEQITQMARSLVTSLDEIVWAVNPHYDSAASLASYLSLFAESFLSLAGIACRFSVADNIPEYPMDSKARHEVFCAFKEALNNVIRHSGATEVQLIFEVAGAQLVLSVIDNGRGFESVAGSPGKDGLVGLNQRMRQLGGDCQITSQPGHGTRVEFHLPLSGVQNGQNRNR